MIWMLLLGVWLGGFTVLLLGAIGDREYDDTLMRQPGDWAALVIWPVMIAHEMVSRRD